jgi:Electron transfer DM13
MKTWKKVAIAVVAVGLLAVWYWFRPDRLFSNVKVNEAMPTAQGSPAMQPIESGTFYSILHPTEGTATIYKMSDGTKVFRFTNFKTSNGPDVHVYMVAAYDAKDNAAVEQAGFIDLGPIKGNIGDQNYALGPEVDLAKYRTVSVWCKLFSVNFGAAPLKADQAVSQN